MSNSNAARKLNRNQVQPFDYELPQERIATRPCYPFHEARLLCANRESRAIEHSEFSYLPLLLNSDDVLVLNNTKVLKARLFGNLELSGAAVELLLIEELGQGRWKAMGRPLRKLRPGSWIRFSNEVRCQVLERLDEYHIEVNFHDSTSDQIFESGTMPIPPYIRDGRGDDRDEADYQTFFAKHQGSVAAPTAGLHFTEELLQVLERRGVEVLEVTLHVGPASFLSAWEYDFLGDAQLREPGTERGKIDPDTLERLKALKMDGKRIIAVGTTVVRMLETVFGEKPFAGGGEVETDLFIRPGYQFRMVDAMITNFHQPKSSHLLLVEAFMGREFLQKSYTAALAGEYKFLSYGDGMFIE